MECQYLRKIELMEQAHLKNIDEICSYYSQQLEVIQNENLDKLEETKKAHSEEVKMLQSLVTQFKDKWISLNKQITKVELDQKDKFPSLSYKEFSNIYAKIFGKYIDFSPVMGLTIDLLEPKDKELITVLSKYTVPVIDRYVIDNVPEDWEELKVFLKNSIPNNLYLLNFNNANFKCLTGSPYIETFKTLFSKRIESLSIHNTHLTRNEFWTIVKNGKYWNVLQFLTSYIITDSECDFGEDMEGWKIETFNFHSTGGTYYCNWLFNPDMILNIFEGIKNWKPLRESLKTLYLENCWYDQKKVLQNAQTKRHS